MSSFFRAFITSSSVIGFSVWCNAGGHCRPGKWVLSLSAISGIEVIVLVPSLICDILVLVFRPRALFSSDQTCFGLLPRFLQTVSKCSLFALKLVCYVNKKRDAVHSDVTYITVCTMRENDRRLIKLEQLNQV